MISSSTVTDDPNMFDYNKYLLYFFVFLLMVVTVCIAIYIAFFTPTSASGPELEMGGVRRHRTLRVFGFRTLANTRSRAVAAPAVEYVELQELAPVYRVPEHGPTLPTYEEAALGRDGGPA
jgi:hypothetical protein